MSTPRSASRGVGSSGDLDGAGGSSTPALDNTNSPYGTAPQPTYAAFSSSNLSTAKRQSTVLVHQKSPLLLATPPQVTRALAYSHPFLLPLNKLVGLLSWTTGDPWESFLLLVVFWATVQYGDTVLRWAGPIITVIGIIAGMYGRRYSPLSSSGWADHPSWTSNNSTASKKAKGSTSAPNGSGGGGGGGNAGAHQRNTSEVTSTRHQKTLDEIVETLKVFTTRCNILLEPLLVMTDFLSTQRTATSATTRPALTTLFVRILAITPFWIALTLPPWRIITTKRVVIVFGTMVLTWHSKVSRVTRTLLWRSAAVRKMARFVTGLEFEGPKKPTPAGQQEKKVGSLQKSQSHSALTAALRRNLGSYSGKETGVKFTFIIYENQRRWVGLGWTNSLFAYERSAWTDEHNNAVPPKDQFELPEVDDGVAKWRWAKNSMWRVDGVGDVKEESEYDGEAGKNGWIYYDNKWNGGRRGQDGWGKWTRRRKWYRDAELVEIDKDAVEQEQSATDEAAGGAYKPSASPSPPKLPPRTNASAQQAVEASNVYSSSLTNSIRSTNSDPFQDEDADSVSVLSTSSKSNSRWRFSGVGSSAASKPPPPRRRKTGESTTTSEKRKSRRTSEAGSIRDSEGNLEPALELEIHGSRREQESWGIGDDVAMGLE
ncbi:hypothetical protein PFICI_14381 [Pestalotiopsis fici W106-1]|uniref:Peroxin/Ferlin domain-containing protein n=1 Tax=Pestalotiopsis fici (strain W106-1 / CGMCC3.15140) TaxID=1229662 RepID=W3WKQ8_PESFW|nr:uncharacterized protein PFICI_14381 [Pestalotiopsis fici W106-1]ETS74515.1 hypothetical protein PFICI_14381 [Pestalotiopsis fici W106-1]